MRALILIIPFLFSGCAQVAELSGGDRDLDPPVLLFADPPHLSTDQQVDRIRLTFDERIRLDNVRDNLLISPPIDPRPVVRIVGPRTIQISIDAPLQPNTTYSFVIGDAVKDLTEGNVAASEPYVFSTGAYVDSLAIAGSVVNAFSGAAEKDAMVLAYHSTDTSTFTSGRPSYATRTDVNGSFVLRHLRSGEYVIRALRDRNSNYRYDLPNEEIAFLDQAVFAVPLDSAISLQRLRMFQEASAEQQVREVKVIPDGALRLVFAKPAETIEVRDLARTGGTLEWWAQWGNARDTVHLWPSDTTALSQGSYRISTEEGIVDTVRYRPIEKMPFFTSVGASLIEKIDGALITLRSGRPIASIDTARIVILRDSIPLPFSAALDTINKRTLHLKAPIRPGDQVVLQVFPRAITDIYDRHNDTLITGLGRAAEGSSATLRIAVKMNEIAEGPFILQLLDQQGNVRREALMDDAEDVITWEKLPPGIANLRLIEDLDRSGRWDTGVLSDRRQPERVWRHQEPVNLRAGWEIELDWSIGALPELENEEVEP